MSRNIGVLATVIAILLLIAACADGPTGQSEDISFLDVALRPDLLVPPPPQRVVFSYSLIGTTWEFSYVGTEKKSSTVDFLQDGRFHERNIWHRDPPRPIVGTSRTSNNDEWEQDGPSVLMTHNDGYSTHIGNLAWDNMYGTASNIKGKTWTWTARRTI